MNTTLLVITLLATPPGGPELTPPNVSPRVQPAPQRMGVPPLRWERIIRKCGAPCLVWARHILDAATSPGGFAWQIKGLAQAARRAYRSGRLRPHHARKLRFAIRRLGLALRRMTADGLLTHRERKQLLQGIIRTGATLHRATQATAHSGRYYPGPRSPRRLPAPPPPAPAPARETGLF